MNAESLEFSRGRLFQFNRMKKERPSDPIYWDGWEEKHLMELVEGSAEVCMSPHVFKIGPAGVYGWPTMSIGPCQLPKGHAGEHKL